MAETAENPRKKIREARLARLRVIEGPSRTVKVYAGSEVLRNAMRHPSGTRFRDTLNEPVEWPNDSFTKRRIKDGSVRTDGPGPAESSEPDETKNAREQADACKPQAKSEPEPKPKAETKSPPKSPPPQASA